MKLTREILREIVQSVFEETRQDTLIEPATYKAKGIPARMDKIKSKHEDELYQKESAKAREKFFDQLRSAKAGKLNYPVQKILLFLIMNLERETPAQIMKRRMGNLREEESKNRIVNKVIDFVEIQRNIFINALERDDRGQLEHMFFEIFGVNPNSFLKDDMKKHRDRELYGVFKKRLIEKINEVFEQFVREYENQRT